MGPSTSADRAGSAVRLVLAEDEALLREGLALALRANGFEVVAAVGNADDLRAEARRHRPDVVVTDIRMPPDRTDDGLRVALDLRRGEPPLGVMVLSAHVVTRYARDLLADRPAGVGYLLKQRVADVASFCADLRRVGEGGTVLDPEVVAAMLTRPAPTIDPLSRLTERQRQVLALIAEGRSNAWIAEKLGITEKAVARHASLIYDALGIAPSPDDHRRVLAVVQLLSRPGPAPAFPEPPSAG